METLAHSIVQEAVKEEISETGRSVEQMAWGVKRSVAERTRELTDEFGDAAKDIAGDAMVQAEGYARSRTKILSGFQVDDLVDQRSALGVCDKSTNAVTIDEQYLEIPESEAEESALLAEAKRVAKHELAHRDLQAASFDREKIVVHPEAGAQGVFTAKDFYEGQAIEEGGQTMDELTPEYRVHRARYQQVLGVVGEGVVADALKSGRLSDIEKAIAEKNDTEQLAV